MLESFPPLPQIFSQLLIMEAQFDENPSHHEEREGHEAFRYNFWF
jgi:hypothetical protein